VEAAVDRAINKERTFLKRMAEKKAGGALIGDKLNSFYAEHKKFLVTTLKCHDRLAQMWCSCNQDIAQEDGPDAAIARVEKNGPETLEAFVCTEGIPWVDLFRE
jgi:hypothetical protein